MQIARAPFSRLPYLPRRVRLAGAVLFTLLLTMMPLLAPANGSRPPPSFAAAILK